MLETLFDATLKQVPVLVSAIIVLALGWFIGNRLGMRWNLRQKRRELDLTAARNFYALYGEFFATWKMWNYFTRDVGADGLQGASRWELLTRACQAEGRLESLFVTLVCERQLTDTDIATLGQFRQLYQQLRESIRDNVALAWDSSQDSDYLNFKSLATKVASLLTGESIAELSTGYSGADAVKRITSNQWETRWGWSRSNRR